MCFSSISKIRKIVVQILLKNVQNVQVSDTTGDTTCTAVCFIKISQLIQDAIIFTLVLWIFVVTIVVRKKSAFEDVNHAGNNAPHIEMSKFSELNIAVPRI